MRLKVKTGIAKKDMMPYLISDAGNVFYLGISCISAGNCVFSTACRAMM